MVSADRYRQSASLCNVVDCRSDSLIILWRFVYRNIAQILYDQLGTDFEPILGCLVSVSAGECSTDLRGSAGRSPEE